MSSTDKCNLLKLKHTGQHAIYSARIQINSRVYNDHPVMFVFCKQHVEELRTNYYVNPGQGLADEIVDYEGRMKLNSPENSEERKKVTRQCGLLRHVSPPPPPPTQKSHKDHVCRNFPLDITLASSYLKGSETSVSKSCLCQGVILLRRML